MGRWLVIGFVLAPSCVLWAQDRPTSESERRVAAIDITALEGDGAINSIRLRHAHEPVVRVRSAGGDPLTGATVTFQLPATGPSGLFPDGSLSLTTQTDSQGSAVARGLRPNSIAGQFEIRVTASWRGSVASATLAQTNAEPAIKSGHSKTIAIVVAIAGAAAGGAVLAARGKSSPSATTTSVAGGSIAAGTPSFGAPH
jgi:hypothetical protein